MSNGIAQINAVRRRSVWALIFRKRFLLVFAPLLCLAGQTFGNKDSRVSPVAGPSLLIRLQRTFDSTSMGKTWDFGPPPPAPGEKGAKCQPKNTVTLHGSDLYRLNCQGCHGESGVGAPPEINSFIDPIRATSVPVIMGRMKKIGMDIKRSDAKVLARQATDAVLDRLHNGGQDMPAFPQLSEGEIRALLPYLDRLAGVPVAKPQQDVTTESTSFHIGEQIVKSTCHTCHSAVGPNPTPQQLLEGVIPPLSTLTTRTSLPEFVRKVTEGAPVVMGTPPLAYRGRMSIFHYLSKDEAASAYLYLSAFPPQ